MVDIDDIDRLADFQANTSEWLNDCVKGENGKPLPVLANVLIGLRAIFLDAFAFDEMLRIPVLMRELVAATRLRAASMHRRGRWSRSGKATASRSQEDQQGCRASGCRYARVRTPISSAARLSQ